MRQLTGLVLRSQSAPADFAAAGPPGASSFTGHVAWQRVPWGASGRDVSRPYGVPWGIMAGAVHPVAGGPIGAAFDSGRSACV